MAKHIPITDEFGLTAQDRAEAIAICDQMQATLARLADDFAKLKDATDQWRTEVLPLIVGGATPSHQPSEESHGKEAQSN